MKRAHEQFRWFGGGWPVNADLPTPAGFAAPRSSSVPRTWPARSRAGPDLDRVVEAVSAYWKAGFTDIAIVQVGDEGQDEFLQRPPARSWTSCAPPRRDLTSAVLGPLGLGDRALQPGLVELPAFLAEVRLVGRVEVLVRFQVDPLVEVRGHQALLRRHALGLAVALLPDPLVPCSPPSLRWLGGTRVIQAHAARAFTR